MPDSWPALTLRLAARAALQPRLAVDLVRTAWAFRRRGWYRRPPFLPLPPAEYLDWRMHTAYGEDAEPRAEDVARYLSWSSRMSRRGGRG